jgi:hypothetical protein
MRRTKTSLPSASKGPCYHEKVSAFALVPLLAGLLASPVGNEQRDAQRTFRRDIAPVFSAKCGGCHRPGGAGPFSLLTYEDVRNRAELIRSVALLQKMPPTLADSDFGAVARDAKLTSADIVALQEWMRSGMKEGSGSLPQAAPSVEWPMGKPDLIVRPKGASTVPSEGAWSLRTFDIEVPLPAEADLYAFDVVPATPGVARQALVAKVERFTQNPFSDFGIDTDRLIGAWGIGYRPWRLPDAGGVRLSANQRLKVRILYHPSGKPENGSFQLGLYFRAQPASHQAIWRTVGSRDFEISGQPPAFTELTSSWRLDRGYRLVSVLPEARRLATSISLAARIGSEWNRNILMLWRWDARWPGAFNFPEAPAITEGTELVARFQYDNSTHTVSGLSLDEIKRLPYNPTVRFGPRPEDELFWMHVQLVPER